MESKKLALVLFSLIFGISIFASYMAYTPTQNERSYTLIEKYYYIIKACQDLCRYAKQNITLNSQCLSDMYPEIWEGVYKLSGWVCDVAHYPREQIDNLKENQCKTFLRGMAKNFVEVNPNCTPIKIYVYGVTKEPVLLLS